MSGRYCPIRSSLTRLVRRPSPCTTWSRWYLSKCLVELVGYVAAGLNCSLLDILYTAASQMHLWIWTQYHHSVSSSVLYYHERNNFTINLEGNLMTRTNSWIIYDWIELYPLCLNGVDREFGVNVRSGRFLFPVSIKEKDGPVLAQGVLD